MWLKVVKRNFFRGIHPLTLDDKGRMSIPSFYRNTFQSVPKSTWIITIDPMDFCLWLYSLKDWEGIEEKLQALPSFQVETRRMTRLLIGHAIEVEVDNQNRILIPTALREYARFKKHIVLMGQGKKFEIWDAQHLEAKRQNWITSAVQQSELSQVIQDLVL